MMNVYTNPAQKEWPLLTQRPTMNQEDLSELVSTVFCDVEKDGDTALKKYTQQFDKAVLNNLLVTSEELREAANNITEELKSAIQIAANNIRSFHKSQLYKEEEIETIKGVVCWRENRAIENIGIYIPGGTAPLFSTVLMLGIPAVIAGCKNIILCTPPNKNGDMHPAILFTADLIGIKTIVKAGGIQAIAALTGGTQTVPKVDKIFGPGNQFVTAAKQYALNCGVAIDMPAGPSEVLVIADESSNPEFIASDLLSQAEHGVDSQVILLSNNVATIDKTLQAIEEQLKELDRGEIALKALDNSKAITFNSIDECIEFSNNYAPEHLILAVENPREFVSKIVNAGSVFLGKYSCESAGDYASGTNHTLPTNGYARNYSGVSVDSFIKKITFQQLNEEGIKNIGPAIEKMAEAEGLVGHKKAVSVRLKSLE